MDTNERDIAGDPHLPCLKKKRAAKSVKSSQQRTHLCVIRQAKKKKKKKKEKGPRADFTSLHVETNRLPILDSYLDFPMRTFDRESKKHRAADFDRLLDSGRVASSSAQASL